MTLLRTPYFSFHAAAGARLIDFGGWEMPVQYAGIIAEHECVRSAVGLFDVSHMGEVRVRGARALDAVDRLMTNRMSDLVDGQARYSPMCRPSGGIIDDLIVYRIAQDDVLVCVNAANRAKDFDWMVENNPFPLPSITGVATSNGAPGSLVRIALPLTSVAATAMTRGSAAKGLSAVFSLFCRPLPPERTITLPRPPRPC